MGNSLKIDLVSDVTASYDQTKVTTLGRAYLQTAPDDADPCVGGPLSRFLDVQTEVGAAPVGPLWFSPNNRLFVLTSVTATAAQIAMYEINSSTGVPAYIGKINFILPNSAATTHACRGIRVYNDSSNSTANWRVYLTTVGSVAINGGIFCINKVGRGDFTPSGTSFVFATSTDQKGVYSVQNPSMMGSLNTDVSCASIFLDTSSNRLYAHHGVSATHQYIVVAVDVASIVYTNQNVTGITVAAPGVVTCNGHGYLLNDIVVFTAGIVPTGLAVGTNYFVKNPALNTFEVGTTAAGGSITTTAGAASGVTVGRAFGQTSSGWLYRTGQLPALTGTMLLVDAEQYCVPTASPLNGSVLNGNACVAVTTSTNLYLGLLSELATVAGQNATVSVASPGVVTCGGAGHGYSANDPISFSVGTLPTGLSLNTQYFVRNPSTYTFEVSLTSGGASINTTGVAGVAIVARAAPAWPSLTTSNLLGTPSQIITPTATMGNYDTTTDDFVYVTNTSKFVAKQLVNNQVRYAFGAIVTDYYETYIDPRLSSWGLNAVAGIARRSGWLFASSLTVGQRGVIYTSIYDDYTYGSSSIITPVVSLPNSIIRGYSHFWEMYDYCGDTLIYYRTTGFGSAAGNWQGPLSKSYESNVPITGDVQFKIEFVAESAGYTMGPLLQSLNISFDSTANMSLSWLGDAENSTRSTESPARTAFFLQTAYASTVPVLHFRAYESDSGSLVRSASTSINAADFDYSTNGGTSWVALGTIPNTVGTLVRYRWPTPPGTNINVCIAES